MSTGTAAVPKINSGNTADVAVVLSPGQVSASYVAAPVLAGSALANAVIQGIVSRTISTVTVRVRATAAVTAGTLTVEVLASGG